MFVGIMSQTNSTVFENLQINEDLGAAVSLVSIQTPRTVLSGIDLHQEHDVDGPDFDILKINDQSVLRLVVYHWFSKSSNLADLRISRGALSEYIREVSKYYRPNPFHNFQHAAAVTHYLFVLLNKIQAHKLFSPLNIFVIMLCALVHDVDHPGNTNLFEINSSSELALLYNDQSVLENHHCSTAFLLLRKPGANVLSKLDTDIQKEVRRFMINAILATDMSKHASLLDEMSQRADPLKFVPYVARIANPNPQSSLDFNEQILLGKILLHTADLSGPVKTFEVARTWATRVTAEFNAQVLKETQLGLPILSFMVAADERSFLKNEFGFSSFFVAPLWRSIVKLFPELDFACKQLERNISTYTSLQEQIDISTCKDGENK